VIIKTITGAVSLYASRRGGEGKSKFRQLEQGGGGRCGFWRIWWKY